MRDGIKVANHLTLPWWDFPELPGLAQHIFERGQKINISMRKTEQAYGGFEDGKRIGSS